MSVHDETWDRCQWCGGVNKTWHGDYHSSKGCLEYDNYHDWNQSKLKIVEKTHYMDGGTIRYIFSDALTLYEDHSLFTKTDGRFFFTFPRKGEKPIEKLADKYLNLIKIYKNEKIKE